MRAGFRHMALHHDLLRCGRHGARAGDGTPTRTARYVGASTFEAGEEIRAGPGFVGILISQGSSHNEPMD
jgi:hypothetical protein